MHEISMFREILIADEPILSLAGILGALLSSDVGIRSLGVTNEGGIACMMALNCRRPCQVVMCLLTVRSICLRAPSVALSGNLISVLPLLRRIGGLAWHHFLLCLLVVPGLTLLLFWLCGLWYCSKHSVCVILLQQRCWHYQYVGFRQLFLSSFSLAGWPGYECQLASVVASSVGWWQRKCDYQSGGSGFVLLEAFYKALEVSVEFC
jgi:hypothetical protein